MGEKRTVFLGPLPVPQNSDSQINVREVPTIDSADYMRRIDLRPAEAIEYAQQGQQGQNGKGDQRQPVFPETPPGVPPIADMGPGDPVGVHQVGADDRKFFFRDLLHMPPPYLSPLIRMRGSISV